MIDVAGFEANCLPHRHDLLEFARKLTGGDRDLAQDIVQDTLTKAMVAWDRFDPDGNVFTAARGWLYRIVSNTFTKDYHYARRRREFLATRPADILEGSFGGVSAVFMPMRLSTESGDARPGQAAFSYGASAMIAAPGEPEPDADFGAEVRAAIVHLEPDHREVLRRHYVLGQPYEVIAAELGIRKGTVCSRLARARAALASRVAAYAGEEYGLCAPSASETSGAGDDADGRETPQVIQTNPECVDGVVARDDRGKFVGVEQAA